MTAGPGRGLWGGLPTPQRRRPERRNRRRLWRAGSPAATAWLAARSPRSARRRRDALTHPPRGPT